MDEDVLVLPGCHDVPPRRDETGVPHVAPIAAANKVQLLARGRIPYSSGSILAAGEQSPAFRVVTDAEHRLLVTGQTEPGDPVDALRVGPVPAAQVGRTALQSLVGTVKPLPLFGVSAGQGDADLA